MAGATEGAAVGDGPGRSSPSFEQLIPTRIHKVSDSLEDVARLMLGEAYGLGFTEARILAYLGERGSASVLDVSRDLRVDKAWISRRLQALASRKLITKNRDSSNSRVTLVTLTGKGKSAVERTMDVARQAYGSIMNGVDEKLANELIATLETNVHAILSQLRSG